MNDAKQLTADASAITKLIDASHEAKEDKFRPHLGPSQLGHSCNRYLWLSFRWAIKPSFNGRMKRLFRRGHNEEDTIIKDLKRIGIEVGGEQTRLSFGPHVSGSLDGIALSGVPGDEFTPYLLEFKTHSKKSFDELVKNGVKKAKPQHVVQMQCYMKGASLKGAIYIAVCKDDDRMYTEVIEFDEHIANKYIERAIRIVAADRMPEPLSNNPSWYECKYCDGYDMCHKSKLTKEVNCRTCAHSTATPESKFHCAIWNANIPTDAQRKGCPSHVLHPDMVPWQLSEADSTEDVAAYVIDGRIVKNGPGAIASKELVI